jgi:hypothetical protein
MASVSKKEIQYLCDVSGRVMLIVLIVFSTYIATNTTLQEMPLPSTATGQTTRAGQQNYTSYSSRPDFPTVTV